MLCPLKIEKATQLYVDIVSYIGISDPHSSLSFLTPSLLGNGTAPAPAQALGCRLIELDDDPYVLRKAYWYDV